MSSSLQIAEQVPETPKNSSQHPKVVMITTLLTALTTIAVAFIGVVPSLRHGDAEEIEVLKRKLNDMESVHSPVNDSNPPDKKLAVHGTIKSKDGKQTLKGYEVYFLPEGNNLLTAKTDDSGMFYKEMPPGTYSIIVRESNNGLSSKGMLDEEDNEVRLDKLQGAIVNYRINRR